MNSLSAERLRLAREKRGFSSAQEAADHFGWTVSTYRSHENGTRGLTQEAARKYGAAFRVAPGWLLGLRDVEQAAVGEVIVVGEAAFGIWREKHLDAEHSVNAQLLSVPQRPGGSMQFAVLVSDQSVNKTISQNEYAICRPATDDAIVAGRLYYIERERGTLIERSIRRAAPTAFGTLGLASDSTDTRFREDTPITPGSDGERISVIGVVIGKYCEFNT